MARSVGGAGLRRRPKQRKGRPVIDVELIAEATLDEFEKSGPTATTVAAVAARLGVTARAIYHYVDNREGMLRAAMRHWARSAPTIAAGADWRADIADYIAAMRIYLARIPTITELGTVEGVIDYSEEFFDNQEANIGRLVALGLDPQAALRIYSELVRFCEAIARLYGATARSEAKIDAYMAGGVAYLSEHTDRFPLSHAAGPVCANDQIATAVELLLDGIDAHLRRSSRSSSQIR